MMTIEYKTYAEGTGPPSLGYAKKGPSWPDLASGIIKVGIPVENVFLREICTLDAVRSVQLKWYILATERIQKLDYLTASRPCTYTYIYVNIGE